MNVEKKIVALIENDVALLRGLERLLRAHGYTVCTFPSAEQFLETRAGLDLACVVFDIYLDGMSGLDLLRALPSRREPPVICMTGDSNYRLRQIAGELGCIDYLLKPFLPSHFMDAVNRAARQAA